MLHYGRLMAVKTITAGVMDEKQVETLAAELNDLCTFVCTPCISSSHTFLIEAEVLKGDGGMFCKICGARCNGVQNHDSRRRDAHR